MRQTKFSMNAFLLIVILLSGLYLFISVDVHDMATFVVTNDNYPIGETGYVVRYQQQNSHDASGIYTGELSHDKCMISGSFGHDWGAYLEGHTYYCNEYKKTKLGFMTCDVVKIDLETFEKELVMKDTMLRGTCASGEMICLQGAVLPGWFPKTNPLFRMFCLSSSRIEARQNAAVVHLVDPKTGADVGSVADDNAMTTEREHFYQESSREEILGKGR